VAVPRSALAVAGEGVFRFELWPWLWPVAGPW
jgi:hypothetical protein